MEAIGVAKLHASLGIPTDYASTRGLLLQPEAEETALVTIETGAASHHRIVRLLRPAADAWSNMDQTARTAGVNLLPLSGFRSVARQTEIIRSKLANGRPITEILRLVAAPGYSEHHTGRALDLADPGILPLQESFGHTTAFAWLTAHASTYQFHLSYPLNNSCGIAFEPWHWCWRA